jgi:hypothetical protein
LAERRAIYNHEASSFLTVFADFMLSLQLIVCLMGADRLLDVSLRLSDSPLPVCSVTAFAAVSRMG